MLNKKELEQKLRKLTFPLFSFFFTGAHNLCYVLGFIVK